jgi:predicted nuclease with TOPRIM domain
VSLVIVVPGVILALFTLAASLAAVFKVNQLKDALEVAERASRAWQEERDAAVAKAERLASNLAELNTRVNELEGEAQRLRERTDISRYFDRQEQNHRELLSEQHENTSSVKSLAVAIETLATMLRPLTAAS